MSFAAENLGEADSAWNHLAKLAGAIIAVQLAFWLLVNPNFIQPEPGPLDPVSVSSFKIAPIDTPDESGIERAKFKPVVANQLALMNVGYHATQTNFNLAAIPKSGLGLSGSVSGDNAKLYVNGQLLWGQGRMTLPDITYHKISRNIVHIPPELLRVGDNRIEAALVFDIAREASFRPMIIGEYESVERSYRWKVFLQQEGRTISVTVGFVLACFIFVALVRAKQQRLLFWMFALTLLWALQNMFIIWAHMPLHGNARGLYYSWITLALSACWPMFIDQWTERPIKYFQYAVIAALVIGLAAIGYWLILSGDVNAFTHTEAILDYAGMLFVATALIRLVAHFVFRRDQRHWEAALLIMLAMLLAFRLANLFLWASSPPYFALSQPLFLFAFAIAYFSRNFRLFQSSAQINTLLQTQLDERTIELEAAHVREKELVRGQAHNEERRRIMRDMHDGLGSHLVSMLMKARRSGSKDAYYEDGLQKALDEMRLMIDSIDSIGESLGSALSTYRKRITPVVKNAGFDFNWSMNYEGELPEYSPRDLLQIFRILQESVTNSLKHSGGDEINVVITAGQDDDTALQIQLSDNGGGIVKKKARGRGVENMKVRAESIGARFTIESGETGAIVKLNLPIAAGRNEKW